MTCGKAYDEGEAVNIIVCTCNGLYLIYKNVLEHGLSKLEVLPVLKKYKDIATGVEVLDISMNGTRDDIAIGLNNSFLLFYS
jgi:hypothetical protein